MKSFQNDPNFAALLRIYAKIEPLLLAISILGFVGIMQTWPIAKQGFIISTSALAFFYILKGLAAVIPSKDIFERFAGILVFFSLALGMLAFEFHVLSWPGWIDLALIAMMDIMLCFLILVFKKKSITAYLGIYELCSLVLVMVYLGKVFYFQMGI
ncbi:MAG: hypothetical protein A3D92_19105 [Bacteroidetes bacterium RIFCSPHIGHO2_02_FULL_44_7]|nr:MAG: hypothetical protein A3D92_19105 [Bacteroidetes bacterium RIFCSPHIGHO2_02_FULL_44_7]